MQQNKVGEPKLFKLFGHFSLLLLLVSTAVTAGSFEDFKKSQTVSFQTYKDERDNAFNNYLKQQWEAYEVYKSAGLYEKPKPKEITPAKPKIAKAVGPKITINVKKTVIVEPKPIQSKQEPVKKIIAVDEPIKTKETIIQKPIVVAQEQKDISFNFYGADLGFNIPHGIKNANFFPQSQKGIGNFFSSAASSEYDALITNIKNVSKQMNLNDWGIYLLVLKISDMSHTNKDNSRLLSWFIFNKMGYAVKIGLAKKHVVLMHYSKKDIYSTPNFKFDNKKYYVISNYDKGNVGRLFSYKQDYPGSLKPLDLSLKTLPVFASNMKKKNLEFKQFGKVYNIEFEYNKNLIDFMATYPQADYETYFNTPLDSRTYEAIALSLKKHLDGKKASDAMNFVLNFVQKAFKYERDDTQFGREKVMFAQETLYFDKSDCEDRAVLFSYLTKELFGVSVLGVKYKDHMATALYVPMDGDTINAGSKKFVIADPTYVNASIGMSMPQYKSIRPESYIVVQKN